MIAHDARRRWRVPRVLRSSAWLRSLALAAEASQHTRPAASVGTLAPRSRERQTRISLRLKMSQPVTTPSRRRRGCRLSGSRTRSSRRRLRVYDGEVVPSVPDIRRRAPRRRWRASLAAAALGRMPSRRRLRKWTNIGGTGPNHGQDRHGGAARRPSWRPNRVWS